MDEWHTEGFIPCFTSARGQLKGENTTLERKDIKNSHSPLDFTEHKAEFIAFDKIHHSSSYNTCQ